MSLAFEIRIKDNAPEIEVATAEVNPICLRILHGSLSNFLPEL